MNVEALKKTSESEFQCCSQAGDPKSPWNGYFSKVKVKFGLMEIWSYEWEMRFSNGITESTVRKDHSIWT